jgi:hypothetical protein
MIKFYHTDKPLKAEDERVADDQTFEGDLKKLHTDSAA